MVRYPLALICVVFLLGALDACSFGTHERNFAPARGPAGIGVRVEASRETGGERTTRFEGELLAVEEESLLVLASGVVTRIRFEAIARAQFDQRGDLASHRGRRLRSSWRSASRAEEAGGGAAPGPELREQLRLVSRFPQGVSPELLQRVLDAYGQSELVVVPSAAAP